MFINIRHIQNDITRPLEAQSKVSSFGPVRNPVKSSTKEKKMEKKMGKVSRICVQNAPPRISIIERKKKKK